MMLWPELEKEWLRFFQGRAIIGILAGSAFTAFWRSTSYMQFVRLNRAE